MAAHVQNGGAGDGQPPPDRDRRAFSNGHYIEKPVAGLMEAMKLAGVGDGFTCCLTCLKITSRKHRKDFLWCTEGCHIHDAEHAGDPCPQLASMNDAWWIKHTGGTRAQNYAHSKTGAIGPWKSGSRRAKEAERAERAADAPPPAQFANPYPNPNSHTGGASGALPGMPGQVPPPSFPPGPFPGHGYPPMPGPYGYGYPSPSPYGYGYPLMPGPYGYGYPLMSGHPYPGYAGHDPNAFRPGFNAPGSAFASPHPAYHPLPHGQSPYPGFGNAGVPPPSSSLPTHPTAFPESFRGSAGVRGRSRGRRRPRETRSALEVLRASQPSKKDEAGNVEMDGQEPEDVPQHEAEGQMVLHEQQEEPAAHDPVARETAQQAMDVAQQYAAHMQHVGQQLDEINRSRQVQELTEGFQHAAITDRGEEFERFLNPRPAPPPPPPAGTHTAAPSNASTNTAVSSNTSTNTAARPASTSTNTATRGLTEPTGPAPRPLPPPEDVDWQKANEDSS